MTELTIRPRLFKEAWALVAILLIALLMRTYDLGGTPLGVHYDEAANVVLATEIAQGARPIFITGYTGKEVLYFYLAAALIWLIDHPLIAMRLASALIGVVSVAITYRAVREWSPDQDAPLAAAQVPGRIDPSRGTRTERSGPQQIALVAAAIQAVNLWAITISRLGFRAQVQPPLQALTVLFIARGLRHGRWRDWAWAGLCCGLAAYTYLAIRAFPILLGLTLLWILAFVPAQRATWNGRWQRLKQIALFLLVAALAFAPLGAFYARNPQFFANRMGQVSVFAAGADRDDPWAAFWHATRVSFAMFTFQGDRNWRFNVAGAPALWWPLGTFFYVGLLIGLRRLFPSRQGTTQRRRGGEGRREEADRGRTRIWRSGASKKIGGEGHKEGADRGRSVGPALSVERTRSPAEGVRASSPPRPELGEGSGPALSVERTRSPAEGVRANDARRRAITLLLLLWLPVMLLPSILGGEDVEISLSLRAIGVMPALFYWPALGLVEGASALRHLIESRATQANTFAGCLANRKRWFARASRAVAGSAVAALLLATGVHTFRQCFYVWGPSTPGYYAASGYMVEAADFLNAHLPSGADCYISAEHYRHPTVALLSKYYAKLKWLIGPDTFAFPQANRRETWYVFTHEAMPPPETLTRILGSPGEEHLAPDGQVAFRVYRFPPQGACPGEGVPSPQPEMGADANLGHTLRFLGYDLNAPPVSGQALDVTLYFQILSKVDRDDYAFFIHLADEQGFQWGGQTFFTYPSSQWEEEEVVQFRRTFAIWDGAPPGLYTLHVGAFSSSLDARLPVLNEAGQMAGTTVPVGPLALARAPEPPEALPPIQHPLQVAWRIGSRLSPCDSRDSRDSRDALTLLGFDQDRHTLRPGETVALSLYWQTTAAIESDYAVSLWLENSQERIPLWEGAPAHGHYPFSQWLAPAFVRDRYALRLPTDAPAGDFDLRLSLLCPDGTPLPISPPGQGGDRDRSHVSLSTSLSMGTIHIQASDRLWEPPPFAHPVGARLGEATMPQVELLGYDLDRAEPVPGGPDRPEIGPGETIHLTLVWRCLSEMDVSYTVFTHLLDEEEQMRGQQDNPPMGGRYPTTLWVPGEVVVDAYDIVVQPDAPPGMHVIEVGMYDPANLQRLPAVDPTGAVGDRILLGNVQIANGK